MNKSFKTIIFDLDGTLANTLPDVRNNINRALEEMGQSVLSEEQTRSAIGPGSEQFLDAVLPESDNLKKQEFLSRFRNHYWNHCLDLTRLFPGMDAVIQSLSDYHLAVATNKPRKTSEKILDGLGVRNAFDTIVGPEDVRHVKPHPEMIINIITRLDGTPSQTLFIGDTDKDMLAGRGAGVALCGAEYGYGDKDALKKQNPDYMIREPKDLLEIIQNNHHETYL